MAVLMQDRSIYEILKAPVLGDVIDPKEPLVWDGERWCLLQEAMGRVVRVEADPADVAKWYGTEGL